jgi:cellulose synthase/poly-beta-1,6-N-acetylglucosamine synthase-like glycosyltransferase
MTHMIFLAACALGAVVVCLPLFILLGASRRGSGITYNDSYQPKVAIITPMFNEGASIRRTIASLLLQDYPEHLREIIIVDDCSTDDSFKHATEALKGVANARVVRNPHNMGKRRSINRAVEMTEAEIVVSVDSDVVVESTAVKRMIRCFSSEKVAAVGGRVAILNERENWLTRMQAVKYYYSYFLMKRVELRFRSVLCLSGCLTAYRRTVLRELLPVLENRSVMGIEIKYGEDRFLTRMIVKAGYETIMNPQAVCRTVGPTSVSVYLSQQLRWRRSNMVDYLGGLSHVWKGHPLVAFYFFSLFVAILLYPALLVCALASGKFLVLMTYQLAIAFLLGVAYRLHAYKDPNASAWNAIPLAFIFPLTYGILTPLALLTLDAGSWETRSHVETPVPAPAATPVKVPLVVSAPQVKLSPAQLIVITSRLSFQTDSHTALGMERSNDQ